MSSARFEEISLVLIRPSLLFFVMIFVAYATALVSIFTALVNASVMPRSSTKCNTIDSGFLSVYIGGAWSLTPLE